MDPPRRRFWTGMGRAFAGAVVFALPILMTMEMWWLGFHMDRLRLALMVVAAVPLLTALSHFIGFEDTFDWREDLRDAFIALTVGAVASGVVLTLFAVIRLDDPPSAVIGKMMVQAVPASFGAMLGRGQFGSSGDREESEKRRQNVTYAGEMFIMAAGALYLGFSVAPTEEMVLIAYRMTPWHGVVLAGVSLAAMHAFVYLLQFKGGETHQSGGAAGVFIRFSVAGYALALLVSLYVLWTFGRADGHAPGQVILATLVLGFPAAIGAAAARVIL